MATTTEIERKFTAPDGYALPDLTLVAGVASVDEPNELRLDATYFDTADLALARNHITLRRRLGGHDAGWHLKQPAGVDRTETHAPLIGRKQDVPAELVDRVWGYVRGRKLVPIARIRNRRREHAVRAADGSVLVLIADDTVTSEAYGEAVPVKRQWHELETELADGPRELLDTIGAALIESGARPATSPSKLAQALGDRFPTADGTSEQSRDKRDRRDVVGAYIREQRDALVGNDPLVRAADVDGVHDMRVAVRRLRSTLRTFRPMLERARTEPLRAELQWLGQLLGAVRDADVLRHRFDQAITAEPADLVVGPIAARIQERLGTSEHDARAALAEAMTSQRYGQLLDKLDAVADGPAIGPGHGTGTARLRKATRKAVRRADARLEIAVALPVRPSGVALPSTTPVSRDPALHEARKAYKRARYAVEALIPTAGRPAERLAKRLKTLQDVLGAHQDAVVAAQLLRDYGMQAHLDGDNAFTYGLLYAHQVASGHEELRHLDRARRRAGHQSVRAWLG